MEFHEVLFLIAGGLAILGAIAHEVAGAPNVLPPLKDAGLSEGTIGLHHFSWHVGTVAVLLMAAMFGLAVWHPAGTILAILATSMSVGFAVLALALAHFVNPALWRTPAPYPWAIIGVLGIAGILLEGAVA